MATPQQNSTSNTPRWLGPFQHFIEASHDHRNPLFWLQWAFTVILGGYILWCYVRGIVNRPTFTKADIVYQEYFASGSSLRNTFTKLGGASGCLRLVVTHELLWVTSWFPFSLFTAAGGLEHVIALRSIQSIEGKKTFGVQNLLLTYADEVGKSRSLRLKPKNTRAFLDALETNAARIGTMIPAANIVPEEPVPTLKVAIYRYRSNLLAVGLFPTVFFVGAEYLHLPSGVFIPVFFATMIYGAWPAISKRAPWPYQFVMMAVWMGGGILGGIVASLISLIFGKPHP